MRPGVLVAALALAGCHTIIDHPIEEVVGLQLLSSGDVEACAMYDHEDDIPTECCDHSEAFRRVHVDTKGGISDDSGACSGRGGVLAETPLADGGKLLFADSNLARLDADGATLWTVPSPFGHISAASADRDGAIYLARGPQVTRIALADGSALWISELR